jgi:hypothetical protein
MQKICGSEIFLTTSDSIDRIDRFTLETRKDLLGWDGTPVSSML